MEIVHLFFHSLRINSQKSNLCVKGQMISVRTLTVYFAKCFSNQWLHCVPPTTAREMQLARLMAKSPPCPQTMLCPCTIQDDDFTPQSLPSDFINKQIGRQTPSLYSLYQQRPMLTRLLAL